MPNENETQILRGRRIVTMDRRNPLATHVAIRAGRILSVGDLDRVRAYSDAKVDERFADHVMMPGLVEAHSHVMEGGVWAYPYVGYHDRTDPAGRFWPGLRDMDAVVARLRESERGLAPDAPLLAWGFDPIFFGGRRMVAADLDAVSATRPVLVMHASFHILNVNSAVLTRAGIGPEANVHGVVRGEDGLPNGELQEKAARFLAMRVVGGELLHAANQPGALDRFTASAARAGVTTVTDLYNELPDDTVQAYRRAAADPAFPMRLVPAFNSRSRPRSSWPMAVRCAVN